MSTLAVDGITNGDGSGAPAFPNGVSGNIITTGNLTAANLTLSGGAYLGGTGSANLLDDYEEGTWTPQFDANTVTWSYSTQAGYYVKIGNMVHASFYLLATVASGTTSYQVTGINFPFASASLSAFHQWAGNVWFQSNTQVTPLMNNNATTFSLYKNQSAVATLTAADVSGLYFVGSISYRSA